MEKVWCVCPQPVGGREGGTALTLCYSTSLAHNLRRKEGEDERERGKKSSDWEDWALKVCKRQMIRWREEEGADPLKSVFL